jgi:DNA-binding protein H-NS
MKKIPAVLISRERRHEQAKEAVEKAIEAIKQYGELAGISTRTLYEYNSLVSFMKKELKREPRNQKAVG